MKIDTDVASHFAENDAQAIRLIALTQQAFSDSEAFGETERDHLTASGFAGNAGQFCLLPATDGETRRMVIGLGDKPLEDQPLALGAFGRNLPEGTYLLDGPEVPLAGLGWAMGGYRFSRYSARKTLPPRLANTVPSGERDIAEAVFATRDLINIPASDMGPDQLEAAVRALAGQHGAKLSVLCGDELLQENLPMVHAVGRASAQAPRVLDLTWGREDAPRVTLVGKGVTFDTGGLNIKPGSSMALMKKDMGGAANVIGLAHMIMSFGLPVRLRLIIGAVENSISSNAFRPGDILSSRKGLTVEIGNTDAEGRLVLGDCLALGDEDAPQIMIDMATLTGAARVALGPDLPPFYTRDDELADGLQKAGEAVFDPMWRMPLWDAYRALLSSPIADINHISTGGFAGSITAALFLERFVEQSKSWAHFDIYG